MTLNKRLDQIELILADVVQKTDRLIESNGRILEIALRADSNAHLAARGVASLTIEMHRRFEKVDQRFEQIDQRFDQQQMQIETLRQEMNQKFVQFEQTQQQILTLLLDRLK
ncbi:hypothetical protein IC229_01310 [Spirosoma sp. BT702]|uniref:Uncharacterized protein n=1 Tax=Spirosoma profusum TaxID=2771354 RepID=A0A927AM82_9BACT|nr:hypothetical protein [Spirosoma profusum]MBD2699254.1 hypothetical protein [Spirosoma profusum]